MVRGSVDAWGSLVSHPGLLVPLEGFVATELDGSPSLVVTTAYVPGAVTLAQAHLQPTQVRGVWGCGRGCGREGSGEGGSVYVCVCACCGRGDAGAGAHLQYSGRWWECVCV